MSDDASLEQETEAKRLVQGPFCEWLCEKPLHHARSLTIVPAMKSGGEINNGTVTLIDLDGHRFGVTCFHVVDAFRRRRAAEPGVQMLIRSTRIDLDKLLTTKMRSLTWPS